MNRPHPKDIKTHLDFMSVCEGMVRSSEKESTIRLYCLVAKNLDKWGLTQDEVDIMEPRGEFQWNGLLEAGWFVYDVKAQRYYPTDLLFGRMLAKGLVALDSQESNTSKLRLFTCHVTYAERSSKHSFFTILDVDEDAARKTCIARMFRLKSLLLRRGGLGTVDVTEIKGPFEAGQILSEQR